MSIRNTERFFEDYPVGLSEEFGSYLVTEQESLEFARRYDPQSFHTDAAAAAESIYGGLIASGWMTGAIMMRLLVEHFISPQASMGSPGLDEIRWLKPVRPGDTLRVRSTVVDSKPSTSKPDRGVIWVLNEVLNQRDEIVMSVKGMSLYRRRPAGNV